MRTRFLLIDYFKRASEGNLGGERFDAFRFPVPHVDSPDHHFELNLDDFDFVSSDSYELEAFPFEDALLKFLSEVFPRAYEEFPVARSGEDSRNGGKLIRFGASTCGLSRLSLYLLAKELFEIFVLKDIDVNFDRFDGNGMIKDVGISDLNVFEIELKEAEDLSSSNISCSADLDIDTFEKTYYKPFRRFFRIEFEIPEMWKNAQYHEEDEGIRFDCSKIAFEKNIYETELGDMIPLPRQAQESIYSMEDITTEYQVAQSGNNLEDHSNSQDKVPALPWNLMSFEVTEIGLELYTGPAFAEDYKFLLSNIKPDLKDNNLDFVDNFMKIFENKEVDILECLSHPGSQEKEPQPMCLTSLLETDIMGLEVEDLTDADQSMVDRVSFEESLILDVEQFSSFKDFAYGPKTSDQMEEDFNDLGEFFDNLVDTELVLLDDTFITFPTPVLRDSKDIMLHSSTLDAVMGSLKPNSASACEEIYLDWHVLQPDTCSDNICSAYRDILQGVDNYDSAPEPHSSTGELMFELLFCDDVCDGLKMSRSKETTDELPGIYSENNEHLDDVKPSQLLENGTLQPENGEQSFPLKPMKGSSEAKSISQFNDLDFFVNGRKGATRTHREDLKENTKGTIIPPSASSTDPILVSDSPEEKSQPWLIEVRSIKLSNHISSLVDRIQNCYYSLLEICCGMRKKHHPFQNDLELLSVPKQKLFNLITETSACQDERVKAHVALYAIKQITHYLCFFGIYPSQLYISSILQNIKYLRARLRPLHLLIEEEHQKAEKGLIESHPSLSVIEEILTSHTSEKAKKVLIIAERVFWWPLRRKLTTMNILFEEVRNCHIYRDQQAHLESNELSDSGLDTVSRSRCFVISHEHIVSSFPFQKFSIILEYGGSYGSSRMAAISPTRAGLPPIIFLKVELEESDFAKIFSRRFDDSGHLESVCEEPRSLPASLNDPDLFKLLNFVPIVEDTAREFFDTADRHEASQLPSLSNMLFPETSGDVAHATTLSPDSIIIINTQNFAKEMIISRRSSYQKILAMEKGGVQVVEREFDLPVDLILSPGVCLVLYDVRSLGADWKVLSSIPERMEHIATNILMTLSFAFSACILVFEGESSFQGAVMECSDELHAAAASLDMHLQLFYSYSYDLTDEIILSCIKDARKLNQGPCPPMPELESLAESFLTSFPSIHPLSAHAILSSGKMIGDFLEWSHERRIEAIGKYKIPQESIVLFSALSRYGDLGESKSGITECSSSVSSALDSDHSSGKMKLAREKNIYADDEEWNLEAMPAGNVDHPNRIFPKNSGKVELKNQNVFSKGDCLDKEQHLYSREMKDFEGNKVRITTAMDEEFKGEVIKNNCSLWDDDFSITGNDRSIRRRLAFDTSNHSSFPSSAEIDCDPDIWIPFRNSDKFQDNTGPATLSQSEALPREFFEEGEMQTPTRNTLAHKKVECPSGVKLLSNAIHSAQLRQGSPWTIEFLNKVKEKTKRQQQIVHSVSCNTCSACPGSSGRTDKLVKRQSPSVFDAHKYQGGSKHTKVAPQMWQKRKPLESARKEKTDLSYVTPWTPLDKRARKVLTFTRNGNEKQSKLVWDDDNDQSVRRRLRI
ncbi:protein SHORTAGE IN CHIASMATA 1 homolog [Aristolochia californica]|uniref:protein SHORTAGE IN CHIASMATA 1 homolog n=1 Tax=Aristolochia californica TaxID=171875 RepID=UPI0035E09FC9